MSQLYATLQAAYKQAMKDRSPTKIALGTVVGEAGTRAKNENRDVEDKDVIKVITNTIAGLNSMVEAGVKTNNQTVVDESKAEIALLTPFLPAAKEQMDLEGLANVVKLLVMKRTTQEGATPKMGVIMADLKAAFDGEYDPKAASAVVKAALEVK